MARKIFKSEERRALFMTIITLAWPTMLEQLMQTAVQYVDTAMVGSIGTQATAAVGSTSTVSWLIGSTVSAIGIGFLSFIARSIGAGDEKMAARASGQAVFAALVSGIAATILALSLSSRVPVWMHVDPSIQDIAGKYFFILYVPMVFRAATIIFGTVLRAAGDTRTPMRIGLLVNMVNVVLNFFMIYPSRRVSLFSARIFVPGAGMGIIGAAIASAISFAVGGISITIALWGHDLVSPRGQRISPDAEILVPCIKTAIPNILQRFGTSLGFVAFASMINSLGEISTAAHTIANTVESAFYIPGYGMQAAASTLAGNAVGAKDNRRLHSLTRMILFIEITLMIISGGLLFAFAPYMMRIFSKDPEVIALGAQVLRMVAVSEPFYGVSIIIEGVMMGVGATMVPFIFNITGMWGVRILGTFICTSKLGLGLTSAWACMIMHNLFVFALFLVYYFRGHWNPNRKETSD